MAVGQLDRALAVLSGCERFRPSLRAGLVEGAPGLFLRYDHYACRHRSHAYPDLAGTERYGRHEAFVDRFLEAALPRVFALAQALRTAALARPAALPAPADADLDRLAEAVEPDLALVETGFGHLVAILCATIAANLMTKSGRVLTLNLPEEAEAVEATLDGEVRHGWESGHLRLALVGADGPSPPVVLDAAPELPAPFRVETLAPEPGTGRKRLRITWPDGARPKALRFQQRGGWPSPQAQLRLVAVAPEARIDLNPVKTALDLVALLGQLSREDARTDGRSLPVYCLGWQYLMKNDFVSMHEVQVALGPAGTQLGALMAAVPLHNCHLPASLRRVIGRTQFSKPLDPERHDETVRQLETVAGLFETTLRLKPFLTHATLMACMRGGTFFPNEERPSLAVVIRARTPEEVAAFAESAAARLEARAKVKIVRIREVTAGLNVRLAEIDDPVAIEVVLFWRDRRGIVRGVAEDARILALDDDWLDGFDTASLAGRPMRVPRRWQPYLADVTDSRWSSLGQPYGLLASIREEVGASLRAVRTAVRDPSLRSPARRWRPSRLPGGLSRLVRASIPRIGPARHGGTGWRLVGSRDLPGDPGIRLTPLIEGRHYVRPAADLVVDLSDQAYEHDLAAPTRMPLSGVATIETPPGTVVRGTILLALPGERLFLPKQSRYAATRTFVDLILRAHEFNPPLSDFFSGLGRSGKGALSLAPQPIRDIPGDVFWASPDEWENWGIWLMQTLPALVHAERIGYDGALLCRAATAWQRRFVEIFAPRLAERLIVQEPGVAYRIGGRLTTIVQDSRTMAQTAFQRDIYAEIAARALRAVAAVPGEERIFVSRLSHSQRNPTYRSLVNEPDLIAALAGLGFRSVEPEQRGILEQIALFARAREIAGLGGAGMFNLLFAPAGASVLDIESSPGWVTSHANIFATSDLRYGVLFGQPIEDAGAHSRWTLPLDRAMPPIRSFFGMDVL